MRMLLQFKKGDIVRHLGLLDLQRTMQRALRRSGLPVAYSKGFNPHIVMSFASALSSGIPGDAELLDVSLCGDVTEEECLGAMNRVLPPSLACSRVRLVDDRFPKVSASLRSAQYKITLRGGDARKIVQSIDRFLAEEEKYGSFVFYISVASRRFGTEKIEIAVRILRKKVVEIVVIRNVEQMPVVKPGAFQLSVVNLKSHRTYNVQSRSRGSTGTCDVSCVLRYLRFVKYDIYIFHVRFLT